jgi:signal transduction histidine kinase
VNAAIAACAKSAADKGVALTADCGEITARFDPRWCGEALGNIIDNAIKYTPSGGRVTITVIEYEMFARIDVTDNGRGIREDDLPKVFTRFWRAAESVDSPGVGIGLYLTREIITACGGYVQVSSRVGNGSTFSAFLSKVKDS